MKGNWFFYSNIIWKFKKCYQNPWWNKLQSFSIEITWLALFAYPNYASHRIVMRINPHPVYPLGAGQPADLFWAVIQTQKTFLSRAGHSLPPGAQEKVQPAASAAAVTTHSGMQAPVRAGTEHNSHLSSLIHQVESVCVVMTGSLAWPVEQKEGSGTCKGGMQPCPSTAQLVLW